MLSMVTRLLHLLSGIFWKIKLDFCLYCFKLKIYMHLGKSLTYNFISRFYFYSRLWKQIFRGGASQHLVLSFLSFIHTAIVSLWRRHLYYFALETLYPVQTIRTGSTQLKSVQLYSCTVVQLYSCTVVQSYSCTVTFTITGNRFPHVPHVNFLKWRLGWLSVSFWPSYQ